MATMMDGVSDDAKFLGSSLFGMMEPMVGKLTFHMKESRPTARTQAALDELVAKQLVSMSALNQFGGVVYSPRLRFPRPTAAQSKRAGKWPVTEKI